jgi:hypothetical protein
MNRLKNCLGTMATLAPWAIAADLFSTCLNDLGLSYNANRTQEQGRILNHATAVSTRSEDLGIRTPPGQLNLITLPLQITVLPDFLAAREQPFGNVGITGSRETVGQASFFK